PAHDRPVALAPLVVARLDAILGHRRPRPNLDDPARDAQVGERLLDDRRLLTQVDLGELGAGADLEQADRRDLPAGRPTGPRAGGRGRVRLRRRLGLDLRRLLARPAAE